MTASVQDVRDASYKVIWSKRDKTSHRFIGALIYSFIRTCEILDWWFPLSGQE